MDTRILTDLLIILAAGFVSGLLCKRLGISMVVGYLVAGALIGRGTLGWVLDEKEEIEHLAEAGVLLLLFSIGLEFSLEELAALKRHLVVGGSVQMVLVAVPVAVFSMVLGMTWRQALLIGSATALSSTVLVFKALAEWGQTATPSGRRAIGILLFQDAALVPFLLLIPLLSDEAEAADPTDYVFLALTTALLVSGVVVLRMALARWIVPLLARFRSPELVVLFVLVILGGATMTTYAAGLPPALGAFAAGLMFSGNRLTAQVDALVLPFRESFAALFFVSLGLLLDPSIIWNEALLIFPGIAGVLILKSAAGFVALRLTGLGWKAALGMGCGLAQLGEFSFVLVLEGWNGGVLTEVDYRRMLCFALGTLIVTPQLLKLGLRWTEQAGASEQGPEPGATTLPDSARAAVVVGIGPVGRQVVSQLEIRGLDVCLVDLSPVNLHSFAELGFRTVAGNGDDPEILRRAQVPQSHLIVVCVPDDETAIRIVKAARLLNPTCPILVRCRYLANRTAVHRAGADRVVVDEAEVSGALVRVLPDVNRSTE